MRRLSAVRRHRPWSVPSEVRAEPAAAATASPSSSSFRPSATATRFARRRSARVPLLPSAPQLADLVTDRDRRGPENQEV